MIKIDRYASDYQLAIKRDRAIKHRLLADWRRSPWIPFATDDRDRRRPIAWLDRVFRVF